MGHPKPVGRCRGCLAAQKMTVDLGKWHIMHHSHFILFPSPACLLWFRGSHMSTIVHAAVSVIS